MMAVIVKFKSFYEKDYNLPTFAATSYASLVGQANLINITEVDGSIIVFYWHGDNWPEIVDPRDGLFRKNSTGQ
jgi:hypothetical protein